MTSFTLEATRVQTPAPTRASIDRVVFAVTDGEITAVEPAQSAAATTLREQSPAHVTLPATTAVTPGFVDLHVHAPQWEQNGTALDLPLEEWLFSYTFPLEASFADRLVAERVYPDLVSTLLAHGTTTAVYFASVHEEATVVLAETCRDLGQRALVGRVAMDHPEGTPEWYRDTDAAAGLAASRRSLLDVTASDNGRGLVRPILTPRFLPACTDELLTGLGQLAAETGTLIQTHGSESDWHAGYAFDRFGQSDTEAIARFGLLRDHTVLAHAPHVRSADLDRIAEAGSAIAHCPISNAYFANAVFPATEAAAAGVRVGLGTDIGAGIRPGVLQQINEAVTVSRLRADGVDATLVSDQRGVAGAAIDTVRAFWMATAGGAEALGLPVGLLEPGRRFDAVAINTTAPGSVIRWRDNEPDANRFEKLARLTTAADIDTVWVDGRRIHQR
jgi:guanine deaminase